MEENKDKDQKGSKDRQDRSINIGSAVNVQNITGDNVQVSFVVGQQIITNQDFVSALDKLKEIFESAKIDPSESQAMETAMAEAEAELKESKPDKGKIGRALERAVTIAKGASNIKELLTLAAPLIKEAAGWLGAAGASLLSMVQSI